MFPNDRSHRNTAEVRRVEDNVTRRFHSLRAANLWRLWHVIQPASPNSIGVGAKRWTSTLHMQWLGCYHERYSTGLNIRSAYFQYFLNDIFYFAKECCMFNYADDNYISVNHKELKLVRDALEEESKIMVEWFNSNSLQANPCKFQGILFKDAKKVNDFRVYVEGTEIEFQSEIDVLGVCIDDDMNFNSHVNNVCKKAGKQVSALQRLTGVLDHKSRMAIYQSFVMANFDYCPLVWFFTSRSSISKLEKIQERALRFVLKDSVSCYDELISKAKMDAFRVSAVKKMATEVFKILNYISPGYFENYFQKARNPYNLRDNNKLVQPMKLTTSHGIKSFQYYGAHLWNSLPTDIKSAVSISQFKGLIRKWSGPDCKCSVCIMILW